MSNWLKQSTAFSVLVGPVLDSAGAAYTGMAIGDFNITKNGTSAAMAASATATHSHNGHYVIAFTTSNTDTLGNLIVSCNKSTYAMSVRTFQVIGASLFDQIVTNGTAYGTSTLTQTQVTGGAYPLQADASGYLKLSTGTGTGQLDFTSGVVKSNLVQILAATITGTAANIVAAFTKWFNVTSPTGTVNSLPDAVPGAAGGLLIAGSNAAVRFPSFIVDSHVFNGGDIGGSLNTIYENSSGTLSIVTNYLYGTSTLDILQAILNQNNLSALANIYGSQSLVVPDEGTKDYAFTLVVRDSHGNLIDLDDVPTLTATLADDTSVASYFSGLTNDSVGSYRFLCSLPFDAPNGSIMIEINGMAGGSARKANFGGIITDVDQSTKINTIISNIATLQSSVDGKASQESMDDAGEQAATVAEGINTKLDTLQTSVEEIPPAPSVDAIAAALAGSTINVNSPVLNGLDLAIVAADDYYAANGRALTITLENTPDITSATLVLKIQTRTALLTLDATPLSATQVQIEIAGTDTKDLPAGTWPTELSGTLADGHQVTLATGQAVITRELPQ